MAALTNTGDGNGINKIHHHNDVMVVIAFVALSVLYVGYVTSVSVVVAVGGVIVASVAGLVGLSCCCRFCICFHILPFLPPLGSLLTMEKVFAFFSI